MVYSKAPTTYYSTLHDSITSLCKTILPLGLKKRCLAAAEHRLWKLQSDNLKWQQDSVHQMLNLMGLHQDDILSEAEVSAFRNHLLDTLLASPPPQHDHPIIINDKLMFLQELLHAKCISEGEYHSSRRPLLQRLAAQGGKFEGKDVIGSKHTKQNSEEEWSVIDLKDEPCLMNKENSNSKKKSKQAGKQVIKGVTSVFSFGSSYKLGKNSIERSIFDSPNLQVHSAQSQIPPPSIYTKSEMRHSEVNSIWDGAEKTKRKPFRTLFHRDKNKKEEHGGGDHDGLEAKEREEKSAKKQWKKRDSDDDTVPLSLNERSESDYEAYLASYRLSSRACDEASDTKLMQNKLHSDVSPPKDEKVLGPKKIELSIIPTEIRSTNTNLNFANGQMIAISTKLSENKAELKNCFSKPWRDHVGEMGSMHHDAKEENSENSNGVDDI